MLRGFGKHLSSCVLEFYRNCARLHLRSEVSSVQLIEPLSALMCSGWFTQRGCSREAGVKSVDDGTIRSVAWPADHIRTSMVRTAGQAVLGTLLSAYCRGAADALVVSCESKCCPLL